MSDFPPHGATDIELRGRVLVFHSHAHLNREEVGRLQHETARRMRGLAGQPWAILGIVDKPVLLTVDAEEAARQVLPQMIELGLKAQAVAFAHPVDRMLVEPQVTRIVGKAIPLEFFDEPADAEAWLNAVISGSAGPPGGSGR